MKRISFVIIAVLISFQAVGCATHRCIMSVCDAVPAYRVPCEFLKCSREGMIPIDLSLLSQQRPEEFHFVDGGDVLGIYVAGVLPAKVDDLTVINQQVQTITSYYPAYGRVSTPGTGVPIEVSPRGTIRLPLLGKVNLKGQTLEQATDTIRLAYEKKGVIQEDRERVIISLLRPRVHRVVVMREDAQSTLPQTLPKISAPYTKIGRGEVVDLPPYENDVLHALAASGGLPGIDVMSEVWIFRNRRVAGEGTPDVPIADEIEAAGSPEALAKKWQAEERQVVKIPLRIFPDQPVPFTQDDILLEDGDVVYMPPRESDNIYTGGMLPGGRIPLPRDRDLDVLEAVAYVSGATGGPSANTAIFRTGPGNVIPPTVCLIVRKLPTGQQLRIRVDLDRALHDPNERIVMMPDDQLLLFYKPGQFYTNLLLNFIGVGVNIIPNT